MASSMSGQWLRADGYLEYVDPKTGETASYCTVADKDSDQVCYIEPYAASTTLSNKRSIARRIGTTYAYDFIGLIEKALVSQWQSAIADGAATEMPLSLLAVDELLDEGGELVRGSRIVGENTVGMVSRHRYPSPRPAPEPRTPDPNPEPRTPTLTRTLTLTLTLALARSAGT